MLLTFSLPAMLPMLIRGVMAAGGDLAPGIESFAADQDAAAFLRTTGRAKRQTCRAAAKPVGARLDLWFGNPRNVRVRPVHKIGVVVLARCRPVAIARAWPHSLAVRIGDGASAGQGEHWPAEAFAHADGFDDVAAARAFFVSAPDSVWTGFCLEW